MCPQCRSRLDAALAFLDRTLPDLVDYKLNRANKPHTGGGGGRRATAPTPIVERVYEVLYESDGRGHAGMEDELRAFARCLHLPYNLKDWTRLPGLMRRYKPLYENGATPAYVPIILTMQRNAVSVLNMDGERVLYGPCPNRACQRELSAPRGVTDVKCHYCGCTFTVKHLLSLRHERLLASPDAGTRDQVLQKLRRNGITVRKGTLRQWIHRGLLHASVEGTATTEQYRLADVYALATRDTTMRGDHDGETDRQTA